MTVKDVPFLLKLEEIFLPESRAKRDAAHGASPAGDELRFAHYTSASAALRIIQHKRFWMRNTTCMADYSEVQHGFLMLNRFLDGLGGRQKFIKVFEPIGTDLAQSTFTLFKSWADNIQYSTYVASFSEHDKSENQHGRLSMWRAFGGDGARVALVFKVPWFSPAAIALNLLFSPVSYSTEDMVHDELDQVVEAIRANSQFLAQVSQSVVVNAFFNTLVSCVTCHKHEGFREEREWRAIYSPDRSPSIYVKHSTEVIGGVPQFVYQLPLDSSVSPDLADLDFARLLDRLIIGPSPFPWAMYQSLVEALHRAGVPSPEQRVVVSGIPIRT